MHFLETMNQERGTKIESISDAALEVLCQYDWPGNVRELENPDRANHRAAPAVETSTVDDVPESIRRKPAPASADNGSRERRPGRVPQARWIDSSPN